MKLFEKISKGKQIAIKIVLFILIWNIVLLPVFLITNNCANNSEKKWFFEEAEQFIRNSNDFNEQYGNILTVEYVEVRLDNEIDKTVAILKIATDKHNTLECTVVYEKTYSSGGAVSPSYYIVN